MQNNKLKKVCIKNGTCYYLDNIIEIKDFDFDHILLSEKSYEDILIYGISYKTPIGVKPFRIMFDKLDGFIRDYHETRYLLFFSLGKYDAI